MRWGRPSVWLLWVWSPWLQWTQVIQCQFIMMVLCWKESLPSMLSIFWAQGINHQLSCAVGRARLWLCCTTENLWSCSGAFRTSNNHSFVRSPGGGGLRKGAQRIQGPPLLWFWWRKPPTVRKFTSQDPETKKGLVAFPKNWSQADLRDSLSRMCVCVCVSGRSKGLCVCLCVYVWFLGHTWCC